MPELFSDEWAKKYMSAWNADEDITDTLQQAGFSSVVSFGFEDEEEPSFTMVIENGRIISTDKSLASDVKWDLRATKENWQSMVVKPPGLMKLGIAYTSRKLRFYKGDYATMIRDPSLAGAFVRSFALMGKVI